MAKKVELPLFLRSYMMYWMESPRSIENRVTMDILMLENRALHPKKVIPTTMNPKATGIKLNDSMRMRVKLTSIKWMNMPNLPNCLIYRRMLTQAMKQPNPWKKFSRLVFWMVLWMYKLNRASDDP